MSEKENAIREQLLLGDRRGRRDHDDSFKSTTTTTADTASTERKNESHTFKTSSLSSARNSFSRDSPVLLSSKLVLRRGEALEELFGIPRHPLVMSSSSSSLRREGAAPAPAAAQSYNSPMETYRTLSESIVGGGTEGAADDAEAWRDVLGMATAAVQDASSSSPQQQREGLLVLRPGAFAVRVSQTNKQTLLFSHRSSPPPPWCARRL
jgi:hypothetical protein